MLTAPTATARTGVPSPATDGAFGDRLRDALGDPALLTAAVWHEVDARLEAAGPEAAELVAAARAADGGKHLRPGLVAASYLAHGGDDPALLRRVAAAQQLVHLALCIHDDLIDGDLVRHGRPNVVGLTVSASQAEGLGPAAAARRGEASALLAGDLALNAAVLALVGAPAAESVRLGLAAAALTAVERAIAGELLDVRAETLAPELSAPLLIATLKTASYSVTLPLLLGAIAAGADDASTARSIERTGTALGIAYQLGDDDLGLFGDPATTGKSTLSDLRDGKRTEHVRLALEWSGGDDREFIARVLGAPDATEADARRVREIVTATGARAAVHGLIETHLDRGLNEARTGLPVELADHLALLAGALRRRDH
ncbi:polyprenyl synthetase family protein [Agromyces sp. NPDC058064]|uniref:polyprenyl synthetase family protein n=1 Tax=Agromyces sp. NPDC058064 TaxID=3346322 RepID=UPI0036DCFBF3